MLVGGPTGIRGIKYLVGIWGEEPFKDIFAHSVQEGLAQVGREVLEGRKGSGIHFKTTTQGSYTKKC